MTAPVGQGLFTAEVSGSHSDILNTVGLLWKGDQHVTETFAGKHTTFQQSVIHALGGIRTRNPNKKKAADPRLRTRCHRDRTLTLIVMGNRAPMRRGLLTY
jgi:hypothetical protein